MTRQVASPDEFTTDNPRAERLEDILRLLDDLGYPEPYIHNPQAGIQLFVIGERHTPEFIPDQISMIGKIRPSAIVHEGLHKGEWYDPAWKTLISSGEEIPVSSNLHLPPDVSAFINLANKLNIPLIGADLADKEIIFRKLQQMGVAQPDQLPLSLVVSLLEELGITVGLSDEDIAMRDDSMVRETHRATIAAPGPIVLITGAGHVQNFIRLKLFENKGFGVVILDQRIKKHS